MATRRLDGCLSRRFAFYHGSVAKKAAHACRHPFLAYWYGHSSVDDEIVKEEAMYKKDDEWWWKRAARTEEIVSGYPW